MGENVTAMVRNVTDLVQEKNRKELKKHAATIHCSNTLSLLQRKISNALLYHAYSELMQKEEHEITVKQLCRLIGYQGNNHAVIKDALKELISTVIEWNLIDDQTGAENWTASSIIASVSLEGPLCYYAYSPRMKQLLHTPSMFGKVDLVIQSKFRSSYGLALYENCIRYRGLPQTKWVSIDLFKKLMGVPPGMYNIFRDFKRRVLDKAVDEVNTYSDLVITAEFIREGRKVVKVRFKLKDRLKKTRLGTTKQAKAIKAELNLPIEQIELKEKLLHQFNLTEIQIDQLLKEYDYRFIQEKIELLEASKSFQTGKVENKAGYLLSAIKNNFQASKASKQAVVNLEQIKLEIELNEVKRIVEEIRSAYAYYREQFIQETIDALPKHEKEKFMKSFYHHAEPTINLILQLQRNKYSLENVMESPQLKAHLRRFAIRELDLLSLCPLEEFVAQLDENRREAWYKLKSYDPDHHLLQPNEDKLA